MKRRKPKPGTTLAGGVWQSSDYLAPLHCGGAIGLERRAGEGESPVGESAQWGLKRRCGESRCLGVQRQGGGKEHLRLNTSERPIANKYCEGKMKRTLNRE